MPPLREISKDELLERFATVPDSVRELFVSEESTARVHKISDELHVPEFVQDVLGREVGYAILGLRKPEETIVAFVTIGASQELAEAIVKRIANDILVEVEEARKNAPPVAPEPIVPSGTPVVQVPVTPKPFVPPPAPEPLASVPAYTPAPPQIVVPAPVVPPVPPPPPIPVSLPPVPEAPRAVPVPEPTPVPPPQPARPRTMASDVEALQNPGETPMRAPVPIPHPAPAPQPIAPTPVPKAIPQPPRPATPVPNASAVHEDLKKYGVDPYREPVE